MKSRPRREDNVIPALIQKKSSAIHHWAHAKNESIARKGSYKEVNLNDLGVSPEDRITIHVLLSKPQLWARVWVMQESTTYPAALLVLAYCTMSWSVLSSILGHSKIRSRHHLELDHGWYKDMIGTPLPKFR